MRTFCSVGASATVRMMSAAPSSAREHHQITEMKPTTPRAPTSAAMMVASE